MRNTIVFICILLPSWLFSQVPEEKIISLYLYNFAKNINWPPGDTEITLGVYGGTKVYNELQVNINGRKVGTATLKIVRINSPEQIKNVHMAFIDTEKTGEFGQLKGIANQSKSILITEDDLAGDGAGISFFRDGSKLKFKINSAVFKTFGYSISQNLTALAIII